MKSKESNLLNINRSLRTLWIMDPAFGKIHRIVTDSGDLWRSRVSILKQIAGDKFKHEAYFRSKEGSQIFV
ncbi:hypothetical protein FRX31_013845 [Thalictrum thalictroides]|uniref:Uncharacterized protein n=1 Tax=Thalictrum thalictroides TaxID=46969 RepID=A0A7J6WIY1_THATH|nr:hypothetical protein FRX31_013845 [Thalictrum thalictroides]